MKEQIKSFLLHENSLKATSLKTYENKLLKLALFLNFNPDFSESDILKFFNTGEFQQLKISTQNLYKIIIRQFLKFLKLDPTFIKLKRFEQDPIKKEDLPTKEELSQLLNNMTRTMDKCLVMIFLEGLRVNEARHVKLEDIINKETHMVIHIRVSKSKKRAVPVVNSVPYIIEWLNQHPDKNNPESYLFSHKRLGVVIPYSVRGLQQIISRNNNLTKNLHPHLFRHTVATNDYGKLTEKEMMMKYGWKTRGMIDKYAHLVDTDLEDKILQLHGIIPRIPNENGINLIENIECPRCKFKNPGHNKFCSRCGSILDIKNLTKYEAAYKKIKNSKEELFALFEEFLQGKLKKSD